MLFWTLLAWGWQIVSHGSLDFWRDTPQQGETSGPPYLHSFKKKCSSLFYVLSFIEEYLQGGKRFICEVWKTIAVGQASHPSILAWIIPWTEEAGGLIHRVAKSSTLWSKTTWCNMAVHLEHAMQTWDDARWYSRTLHIVRITQRGWLHLQRLFNFSDCVQEVFI